MAKTLKRTAAFTALGRALMSGARGGPSLGKRIAAIPRMIRATGKGEYDGGMRLAMMAAAAAYIVSPIDFVPEALPDRLRPGRRRADGHLAGRQRAGRDASGSWSGSSAGRRWSLGTW